MKVRRHCLGVGVLWAFCFGALHANVAVPALFVMTTSCHMAVALEEDVALPVVRADGERDNVIVTVVETGPQQSIQGEPQRKGRRGRGWFRGRRVYEKNHSSIKAGYAKPAKRASKAAADVLSGDQTIALATVVASDGYLVSKASLLDGELKCRFADGRELDARVVTVNEDYDLALLHVDSEDLLVAPWRASDASPGTFVAAIDRKGETLGIGVVSADARSVRGARRGPARRGWLGVRLGGGDAGTGVTDVVDGSAAKKAGLRPGDRIKKIDGAGMKTMEQIIDTVGSHGPGDAISIVIQRAGKELEVTATLGKTASGRDPRDSWGGGPFSQRRAGFPRVLSHDVIIRPKQCGGPLIDTDGNVVGVNIARALRVATYAIPADTVQKLVSAMRDSE